jgi:hypothetical protein
MEIKMPDLEFRDPRVSHDWEDFAAREDFRRGSSREVTPVHETSFAAALLEAYYPATETERARPSMNSAFMLGEFAGACVRAAERWRAFAPRRAV